MRLFSCKANLKNAVYMYHYFIYISHCGFLFWVFQFLWFLSRSTAVKSKPNSLPHSPNKHITVKMASALLTQVKICSQDECFTSFQHSLVQSFLCYKQLYTESYGEKPVRTNPKSLFLQNNIPKKQPQTKLNSHNNNMSNGITPFNMCTISFLFVLQCSRQG